MSTYTGMFRLFPIEGSSIDGFVDHDRELIKRSILNILKTEKGSRVYDPEYGTNLHRLIHEQNINRIRNIAKTEIQTVIEKYEPRVQVLRIEAYPHGNLEQEVIIVMELLYLEFETTEILELRLATDQQWINDSTVGYDPKESIFKRT